MFFKKTVRIIIRNQNLAIETKTGSNLYQVLVNENVIKPTLCKGNGQCGKCKVHINQKNMQKPTKKEQLVLAAINLEAGYRLACQTTVKDNMTVDTSEITTSTMPNDLYIKHLSKPVAEPEISDIPQDLNIEDTLYQEPADDIIPPEIMTPPVPEVPAGIYNIESGAGSAALEPKTDAYAEQANIKKEKDKDKEREKEYGKLDGLLLIQQRGNVRFFLYSAAIDSITQEGTVTESTDLDWYVDNSMLSEYIHDVLKIKDVERVIIITDRYKSEDSENLFNLALYKPFDIGSMQCEIIRPNKELGDLSLFLRFLSVKGKKRLFIPLDKPNRAYYFADKFVAEMPSFAQFVPGNLMEIIKVGENPVVNISEDLKTIKCAKEYDAPDSVLLPVLMRIANILTSKKLADNELRLFSRMDLPSGTPLEYVVKMATIDDENVFYLHRDKDTSLYISQSTLTKLNHIRKYMHFITEYTERNLGPIETIIFSTQQQMPELLNGMVKLSFVPKKYENTIVHDTGDSGVTAVRLFQEMDVRKYITNNFGGFARPE